MKPPCHLYVLVRKGLACKAGEIQQRFQCQAHNISLLQTVRTRIFFFLSSFFIFYFLLLFQRKEKGVGNSLFLSHLCIISSYWVCLSFEGQSWITCILYVSICKYIK